mmetsp:Transcript_99579/g.197386  ORF Transcript_99579/g.197386 Transcript_99579/m.197386 type:complete len:301 (+) Transcript_99579:272-1174(+)
MTETTVGDRGASFTGEVIAAVVAPLRRRLQHSGVARPCAGAEFTIHEEPWCSLAELDSASGLHFPWRSWFLTDGGPMPNLPGMASTEAITRRSGLSMDVVRVVEPTVVRALNAGFPPDAVARETPVRRGRPENVLCNAWCSRSRSLRAGTSIALNERSTRPVTSPAITTSLWVASCRPKSNDNLVLSIPLGLTLPRLSQLCERTCAAATWKLWAREGIPSLRWPRTPRGCGETAAGGAGTSNVACRAGTSSVSKRLVNSDTVLLSSACNCVAAMSRSCASARSSARMSAASRRNRLLTST